MRELKPDELYLKGRVQIETALGALAFTGANPKAQHRLQVFLDVHTELTNGENQNDFTMYIEGSEIAQEKADIISSLEALELSNATSQDLRMAAEALRNILQDSI